MHSFIRNLLVTGLAALALAACGSSTMTEQSGGMTAPMQPKLAFNVATIQVVSMVSAANQTASNAVQPAVPLVERVADWARTHLSAVGATGAGSFTITDASIVRTDLGSDVGGTGLMRAPQTIRYDATVAASFEILDSAGARQGYANTEVSLSRTMAPYESDAARDILLRDLSDAVMAEFDTEMQKVLRANVGAFMR